MIVVRSGRNALEFAVGGVLVALLFLGRVRPVSASLRALRAPHVDKDLSNTHIVTFNLTADTQRLNLSCNSIRDLFGDSFERTPSLRSLDLSHNRIESLAGEPFAKLTVLRALNLSANLLGHFDFQWMGASPLQLLDLRSNRLRSLSSHRSQTPSQSLLVLDLADNRFSGNLTIDFVNLQVLTLDNNRDLTSIQIANPLPLTNLSINGMTAFADYFHLFAGYENFTRLRYLSMTNCSWDPNLNMLHFVELAEQLDYLDFRFSSIFCSNHSNLQYFQTLIRDFPLNSDLKCLGPSTFKGRKVKNLYLSPMLVKQRLHFAIIFPVIVIFILLITLLTVLSLTEVRFLRFRRQTNYSKLDSIAAIPSVYNPVYVRCNDLVDVVV